MPEHSHDEIDTVHEKGDEIDPVEETRLVLSNVTVFELHSFKCKQNDWSQQAYHVEHYNSCRFIFMEKYLVKEGHQKAADVQPELEQKENPGLLESGVYHAFDGKHFIDAVAILLKYFAQ